MSTYIDLEKYTAHHPSNTGSAVGEVWAFVSRDGDGRESIIGSEIGPLGTQHFITGNPAVCSIMCDIVRRNRASFEKDGQSVHMLRFTGREETKL